MNPKLQYVSIALFLILLAPALYAQVPQVISFQGVLSDADGSPLPDGSHQVVFSLYEAEADGDAIWTETQQVGVTSGVFGVLLGSETALDLPFDRPYWLGVTIGSDAELAPRAPLTAAPYSLGGRSTVAEWKAGESLVVRDGSGNTMHLLGSDGSFEHAGRGEVIGRLDVRANDSELTALHARVGDPRGFTDLGSGVFGEGPTGVLGVGEVGVAGRGMGEESVGVAGHGSAIGVQGSSGKGPGTAAFRSLGHLHVAKDGHVVLDEVDLDQTAFRYLVWSNDDTVRWRPLPEEEPDIFIRVPGFVATEGTGIQIRTAEGEVVFTADTDGSTTQSGSASVGGDGITLTGGGITFADGTKQSTASTGGGGAAFDGTLNNTALTIIGPDGNSVVQLTPDGRVDAASIFFPDNTSISDGGFFLPEGPSVTPDGFSIPGGPSLTPGGLDIPDGPTVGPGGVIFEGGPTFTTDGFGFPSGPSLGPNGLNIPDGPSVTPSGFGFPDGPLFGPDGLIFPNAVSFGSGGFEGDVHFGGHVTFGSAFNILDGPSVTRDGFGFPSGPMFGPDGLNFPGGPSLGPDGFIFPGPTGDIFVNNDGFSVRDPDGSYRIHMNPFGDAFFPGHVTVGSISKQSGSFKIDHPLDPENKYLYHSFVESPDMMNVYNGNAALDAGGEAWVEMPEWFEALNQDYRYQLTAIGAPGPNLFIAEEMDGNRFKIAGGVPGMKVSWQVTGIRRDRYAEENRIQVEVEKPAGERGTLLYKNEGGAQ